MVKMFAYLLQRLFQQESDRLVVLNRPTSSTKTETYQLYNKKVYIEDTLCIIGKLICPFALEA